ncbi:MAG: hypothetical protein IMZ62_13000 [Chloroflexi bacterium]|nr:hypothetical protein [Chloroflexota bacterium]MBE3118196.1 hypothetical protein [Candidatus Atribacteria bacterium]
MSYENDQLREAAHACIGADRMAVGLSSIPNKIAGDLEAVQSLRAQLSASQARERAAVERAEKSDALLQQYRDLVARNHAESVAAAQAATDNYMGQIRTLSARAEKAEAAGAATWRDHAITGCMACSCGPLGDTSATRCQGCDESYSHYKAIPNPGQALLDELTRLRADIKRTEFARRTAHKACNGVYDLLMTRGGDYVVTRSAVEQAVAVVCVGIRDGGLSTSPVLDSEAAAKEPK